MVNPFGTLYNPASICAHLLRSLSEREYDVNSPELIESEAVWHSWMHHSTFSCDDRDELVSRMNTALHTTAERLRTADWLLLTFGTSYVYRLKANDLLVANCHKQPDALFVRQRMAAYDIVDMFTTALQLMQAVNPKLHVVLTVSPIRHSRDGMHENQLSKAELLLATDALSKRSTLNSKLSTLLLPCLRTAARRTARLPLLRRRPRASVGPGCRLHLRALLRHICNSAGIEHFPQYHLDMVRLGLGLYGLNRRLGNRNCYCLVHGKQAPYLGNICMDVCMIDVTDIPDVHEGDFVTIFGERLPVTVLSDAIGTIPYEVLTGISQRVQKVFVQE